jgi:hypothetical protein
MDTLRRGERVAVALCPVLCAALIAMTWRSEPPAAAVWVQVTVFGCTALWFVRATAAASPARPRSLADMHHALMAASMIWMLTAIPATRSGGPTGSAMPTMPTAAVATPVRVVSVLIAVYFGLAAVPWLGRGIGLGPRARDPMAASQGVMSAGMAAMIFAML